MTTFETLPLSAPRRSAQAMIAMMVTAPFDLIQPVNPLGARLGEIGDRGLVDGPIGALCDCADGVCEGNHLRLQRV